MWKKITYKKESIIDPISLGGALIAGGAAALTALNVGIFTRNISNSQAVALHMRTPVEQGGHGRSEDEVNHNNADFEHDVAHGKHSILQPDENLSHDDPTDLTNENSGEWETGE